MNKNITVGAGIGTALLMSFGLVGLIIFTIFISPWFTFWLAYFSGWIAKIVIGKYLVAGFALLGLDIPLDKIPLIAGVLGFIGGFFKTTNYNRPSIKTSDN